MLPQKSDSIMAIIEEKNSKPEIDTRLPEYRSRRVSGKTWTVDTENWIKNISEECLKYRKLHSYKSKKYNWINNLFMYISIILGPTVGMLSATNITIQNQTIIPVVILCVSFMNGIVLSIVKFRKWEELSILHKVSSAKYLSLHTNCVKQLSMIPSERDDCETYLNWLNHNYNTLFLTSPSISEEEEQVVYTKNTESDIVEDGRLKYEMQRFQNHLDII